MPRLESRLCLRVRISVWLLGAVQAVLGIPSRRSRLTPIETFEDEDADETDSPLLRRGPPCTSAPESPSAIGWLLNENQRWRDGTQEFEVKRASE